MKQNSDNLSRKSFIASSLIRTPTKGHVLITPKKRSPRVKSGNYVDGRRVTEILNAHHEKRKSIIQAYNEHREELVKQGVPEAELPPVDIPEEKIPPLPDAVGEAIERIASGYARKFSAATDVEEMTRCGVLLAFENLARIYDPAKSKTKNCFSLITQLCYWGFLNYFTAEKRTLSEKNSFLEGLANGQVTIGNVVHDQNHNTALKELRKIVDDYNKEQAHFAEMNSKEARSYRDVKDEVVETAEREIER
ncbi:RNA polymerase sigma factor [Agrobacterium phage OLIVR5]|uniref:RNA polymerase sigma factor n=1 Tax=Agrobacterium phage OLIVR5 TaxID=2723773 RepID=A0A858MTJ7_9CAUD|nr:RNA polymerase sigma factor [Agrobacterium phage OLIVR5]QIW87731.1 RNA polymerase sigma factor [Agrobacterium phage OLIVR5]QIW87993.1 RNA polymerase sigma factor [Agrobacterium phage OLIVR6]